MNGLIWIGQIALAAVFFVAGGSKIFAYRRMVQTLRGLPRRTTIQMPRRLAVPIGVLEIAGAIGVIMPAELTPANLAQDYLLVRVAASVLALIMVGATFYHFRRNEPAAPTITTFLLALFVIVGRWPH
jgi:uncharacterized membrane protein YphA (DoxX/SURF4 family)